MTQSLAILSRERVASIRDVQRNPSRVLCGITRVIRGSKTIGFFLSNAEWDELIEDIEASQSSILKKSISKARRELTSHKTVPLKQIAKQYGISC